MIRVNHYKDNYLSDFLRKTPQRLSIRLEDVDSGLRHQITNYTGGGVGQVAIAIVSRRIASEETD